jgi:hypothetical protein
LPPDNIDDKLPNIGSGKAVHSQNSVQVAQALKRLSAGIVQAHQVPTGVMRNLTGYKQVVAYALSVLILSGRWQPCGAFGFVHGCDA